MRRRGTFAGRVVLAVGLLGVLAPAAGAAAPRAAAGPQSPPPRAYIVVDAGTGAIVSGDHIHDALPVASTAKIMTAITAVERLAPDATIPVSPRAAAVEPMKIAMQAGQRWPLEDTIAALMMVSANDAAYALAEAAGGSLEGFAEVMNATARRLGMRDSTFTDPSGLDTAGSFRGGPAASAYDLAIATRNALTVPVITKYAALLRYEFTDPGGGAHNLTNHNRFLPDNGYNYAGATGFKTGFTNRAGHTFVGTATRNDRTLIVVILNTYDAYGWAAALLDVSFATAPDAPGTGDTIPPVRLSPYSARVADLQGFLTLARGVAAAAAATPPVSAAAPEPAAAAPTGRTTAGRTSERSPGQGGSPLFSVRNFVILVLVLLVGLVLLRRRAVKRRRARRLARRRATAAMMRRGTLPIVDGKYRTGTRLGPPVESHVNIHPLPERRSSGGRG